MTAVVRSSVRVLVGEERNPGAPKEGSAPRARTRARRATQNRRSRDKFYESNHNKRNEQAPHPNATTGARTTQGRAPQQRKGTEPAQTQQHSQQGHTAKKAQEPSGKNRTKGEPEGGQALQDHKGPRRATQKHVTAATRFSVSNHTNRKEQAPRQRAPKAHTPNSARTRSTQAGSKHNAGPVVHRNGNAGEAEEQSTCLHTLSRLVEWFSSVE